MSDRYYCCSCKHTFDDPKQVYEPDGLDTPPYRYSDICPYCRSDDFYEIIGECICCGETICEGDRYYKVNDSFSNLYCENCIEEKE